MNFKISRRENEKNQNFIFKKIKNIIHFPLKNKNFLKTLCKLKFFM